jgi:hypothetical protein
MRSIVLLLFVSLLLLNCSGSEPSSTEQQKEGPVKTEIKTTDGKYQLYVDGQPFWIDGAGLEFGDVENLAKHGSNSFRTWRTDNGQSTGKEVLDRALRNGLYVTMGIEVARERHGFNYDDEAAVAEQFERIKKEVQLYKDHPALIIWAVGNELNLHSTNPKVWNAVNQISEYIHEVDPNHLTTTTLAGINKDVVDDIKERVPDIDLLSIQMYGDLPNLPRYIKESEWTKPYMVTEWGATGHWEVAKTEWDAPIENNSTVKAKFYHDRYLQAIAPYKDQCVGSYVFLWGQKQERTPTWYGTFLRTGEETETIDVMHYIWNGKWPANRTPRLDSFLLEGKTAYDNIYLEPSTSYEAQVFTTEPDQDPVTYEWVVMPESTDLGEGGDYEETPEALDELFEGESTDKANFKAPKKEGAYRLFVYVYDGQGHAAHANIPFYVK